MLKLLNRGVLIFLIVALTMGCGARSAKETHHYTPDELEVSASFHQISNVEELRFVGQAYEQFDLEEYSRNISDYKKMKIRWSVKEGADTTKYTEPPVIIVLHVEKREPEHNYDDVEAGVIHAYNVDLIKVVGGINVAGIYELLDENNLLEYVESHFFTVFHTRSFEQGSMDFSMYEAAYPPECFFVYFDEDSNSGFVVSLVLDEEGF